MKLLFLDIDGVLNDHTRMASGYCTIHTDKGDLLNQILDAHSDVQIVISSAWRYLVTGSHMTVKGFENMLLTYGLKVFNRVHGVTRVDLNWDECRSRQILDYVQSTFFGSALPVFVVLDDLHMGIPELVQTSGSVGLTQEHVDEVIRRFHEVQP